MPDISELNSCCSILEIGCFNEDSSYDYEWNTNKKPTVELLYRNIVDHFLDNYYLNNENSPDLPTSFLAVTRNDYQILWAKVLEEAGFKGKPIASRHAEDPKEKILTLWTRHTIPKEVKALLKKYKKESEDDNW